MRRALLLAWRLHRWELAFMTLACLALAGASGYLAIDMRLMLAGCGSGSIAGIPCTSPFVFQDLHGATVGLLMTLAGVLPFAVGLVLGVPLAARELEHRTAQIAWALAGSRLRWLAWRAAPMAIATVILVSPPAFAADQMLRARWPHDDVGFLEYGLHGVPLVMRAVLALAIGMGIGAVIGRQLPALLVGGLLSLAVAVGLNLAVALWVTTDELAATTEQQLEETLDPNARLGVRPVSSEYRMPDGTVISDEEAEAIIAAAYEAAGESEPDRATLPQWVSYEIPPHRYPDVVLRESIAIAAATVLVVGATGLLVRRRGVA
jgi:hypothetical protein